MKTRGKIIRYTVILLVLLSVSFIRAQKIEFVYTSSGISLVHQYKAEIKMEAATLTNASSFQYINEEQKKAYLEDLSGTSAVVILGDAGVKAAQSIRYDVPVIIINSLEGSSANGLIIRVFDGDYKGVVPSKCIKVNDGGSFWIAKKDFKPGRELGFVCDKKSSLAVVQKIISALN